MDALGEQRKVRNFCIGVSILMAIGAIVWWYSNVQPLPNIVSLSSQSCSDTCE